MPGFDYLMDFILFDTGHGGGGRLKSLCANKYSIRQGENGPKELNSYSTIGISPKLQLRRSLNSKTLSTAHNGKTNSGRPG